MILTKGLMLRGDPRDEIVKKIEQVKADSIIVGSRGMGSIKRFFIGSVSDYCVHNCKCTVIVHKGETV